MNSIEGKTALVTGGGKRLGRAIALALAKQGANILVHYHNSESQAQQVLEESRAFGVQAWKIQADLELENAGQTLAMNCENRTGQVDILINSASIFPEGTLSSSSEQDFVSNFKINALSPFYLSRTLFQHRQPGVVVNFLDARILDFDKNHVPYHVSKRAFFSLTKMMSIEFAPQVRVNGIAPGLILPPEGEDDRYLEKLSHTNPLNTHGSIEDIVDATIFLITARFVTGQVLYVDGGRHLKGYLYA